MPCRLNIIAQKYYATLLQTIMYGVQARIQHSTSTTAGRIIGAAKSLVTNCAHLDLAATTLQIIS